MASVVGSASCRLVFERAGDARRGAERRLLIEEPRHFEIGVDARLQAAEEFHEETFAVDDRGVALLRLEDLRGRSPAPRSSRKARAACRRPRRCPP